MLPPRSHHIISLDGPGRNLISRREALVRFPLHLEVGLGAALKQAGSRPLKAGQPWTQEGLRFEEYAPEAKYLNGY